ncbi:MAG TPA: autotransporter outer membrane beta-barrel domain-containing protein, partial [Burkholderiales bacterium]|nr:autotransporter outer membrane beta-barrel domain-containing protein [Burkholderiales bacterium]
DVNLVASKATQRSLRAGAGIRMSGASSARGMDLAPRFSIGWSHELMDRAPSSDMRFVATTGTFPVNGAAIGRDALTLSASLGARLRRNVTFHIGANAEARRNFTEYGAIAALVAHW